MNGKNTVAMTAVEQFEGHGGGAFPGIESATGRTETAFAAKRHKF